MKKEEVSEPNKVFTTEFVVRTCASLMVCIIGIIILMEIGLLSNKELGLFLLLW